MGIVYLLHFDKPFGHAKHYTGFVEHDVERRLKEHERGYGSRLVGAARKAGINFSLARLWHDVDRKYERDLKKRGGATRHCPMCKGQKIGTAV